ncbi:MAG: exporter, HasE-like [Ramlibacter sp.]|jgi:protease secretion system membrane fusion protein|nr:exporter, HasE-like [Ramlibacter sp.]
MFRLSSSQRPDPASSPAPDELADPAGPDDARRIVRIGLWVLGIGFGGFLAWAALAPLDEGVAAPATVSVATNRKAVQHLSGGIVKELMVREGDQVREGQPLLRLDTGVANANYEGSRQRYLGLRAVQARLLAEIAGSSTIKWPPELVAAAAQDPLVRQQMDNQQQLLASRRGALAADLQGIQESIRGYEGMIQSYQAMAESRRNQIALLQDELKNTSGLVQEGYAPRNRMLELQRMAAELTTSQAELQGNLMRSRQAVSEQRQRAIARQQEYRKEIEQQLADASRDVIGEGEKLRALENDLARTDVRSPATGQVVGLAIHTVGGVVQAGQKLMDVVPAGEPLLLDAKVQPRFVDSVRNGLPVDIRFSAFAHTPQLVVGGQVQSVSGDLVTDAPNTPPYYLVRVAVTPEGLRKLGPRQLQPGMPAEVVVRTGERSLLTYLLHPLTKRIAASMNEE